MGRQVEVGFSPQLELQLVGQWKLKINQMGLIMA
jgi:hypothetical protein